jgi:hypothetical protein
MLTPQQLADAIDEAECSGTMESVAALLHATHPETAERIRDLPFGGETTKPQVHARARADALLLHLELDVTDPREKARCIELLYYAGAVTKQASRLATGSGIPHEVNAGALRLMTLICSNPKRKAARLALLRAATESNFSDQDSRFSKSPTPE